MRDRSDRSRWAVHLGVQCLACTGGYLIDFFGSARTISLYLLNGAVAEGTLRSSYR